MRLTVVYSDRPSCYAALHSADANALFASLGAARHFCRPLRLDRTEGGGSAAAARLFVGWVGDAALAAGTLELARPFAACLGLQEGESLTASAVTDAVVAASVMVQPHSVDDWEVVELQAGFIEEHLLAQVAVLTPGMVFTVWINGQMPVKLRVDPNDPNRADCFLLDRNSELVIESRKRAVADSPEKPYAVFGGKPGREQGPAVRLRVLTAAPGAGGFDRLDAPVARMHPEDLDRLAGCAAPERCLAWLQGRSKAARPPDSASSGQDAPGGAADGSGPRHVPASPRLLQIIADDQVPRQHLVIGLRQAEYTWLPCFSLVRTWRCRQVPVYVPHIELVPLSPCSSEEDRGCSASEEDSAWVSRLFREFVNHCGEVDLMDGAIIHLRNSDATGTSTAAGENPDIVAAAQVCNGAGKEGLKVVSTSSEVTDLYDGLSDIDDIYQPATIEVVCATGGIYEIDLGLDEDISSLPAWPPVGESRQDGMALRPVLQRPDGVLVAVRFVLGAARDDLRNACTPPFIRLTPSTLANDLKVTVAMPADAGDAGSANKEVQKPVGSGVVAPLPEPLELLWSAVKGLGGHDEEGWREVVRLVTPEESSTPLDDLKLFKEPADMLHKHILAQLGCPIPEDPEQAEPDPLDPSVAGSVVPGATAVMGTTGTGKTLMCRRVLADLRAKGVMPLEVACTKLGQPSRKFKAVQDWLYAIFKFACWYSPSVILLDDFGALCPDVEQGAVSLSITEERSVFLAEMLLDLLPEVRASGARVALVATLPDQSAVHRVLWCHPAMEHKVSLRPPHLKERPEILQTLCKQKARGEYSVDESLAAEGALDDWGGNVDGYSVADLSRLVDRACIEATVEASSGLLRNESSSTWNERPRFALRHLERACQGFVPAMLADQSFFTSDVGLSDIGGLEEAKQALMDMLTMPTKYAILIDRAPVRGHRGLMLVGPPGCGKTMLVHAAAKETKGLLRFLTVKGPELLSKYIGASEAGVRQVFERAAAAAPSVIFFDEIEALAPRRGGDSTGVTDRVVNQMLCYLDGVEDRGRVFVIAATGRPDLVDAALMRPGRFDKICFCGLPSEADKLQVCEILAKKNNLVVGPSTRSSQATELREQLQALVSRMPRLFTCADVNALFSSAKIEAVNEALHAEQPSNGAPRPAPTMTMAHVYTALATAKASVSEADERRYARLFAPYQPGTRPSVVHRDGPDKQNAGQKVALA